MTNLKKYESTPNNIMLALDNIFKEFDTTHSELENRIKSVRDQMKKDFDALKLSMIENTGDNENTNDQHVQSMTSRVSNVDGNFTAYREVTTNGVTTYQKGIPIRNGNYMWMTCPESEEETAKEYLENVSFEDNSEDKTSRITFDDDEFENRINALLAGEHFLEDENDPSQEPTAEELNELEAMVDTSDKQQESEPKGKFVYDAVARKFVFKKE